MCSAAPCSTCGKTTWRGCGQHVDAVMARVPADERCQCAPPQPSSLLRRLFSRSRLDAGYIQ